MNDTLLRQLDPADPPRTELSERARADLDRILSNARDPLPSKLRRGHRVGVGLTAAAVLAAVGVLAPSALRSGDSAFASWRPTAAMLTAAQAAEAGERCRDQLAESGAVPTEVDVVLADRRGDWTTVFLSGPGGYTGSCITDASAGWFRHDMIGSSGVATGLPPTGERAVLATDLGTGRLAAGEIFLAAGFAGTEVTAVTLQTTSHGLVTASISNGHFALWFPGDELAGISSVPVQVEYADGSTATVELKL